MAPATEAVSSADADYFEQVSSAERRLGAVVAGTYRITRHIGSGGSSHVFEAEHLRLGKLFALKLLRPELDANRRTVKRFRREARAVARLKSEHIVSVVDCGELDDATPYLVMELVAGEDLRSLLHREGALPTRRAVALLVEACQGLAVVHEAGLVHRDLKPENLFVTRRSTGEDWCKVLDFGVAKMDASLSTAEHAIVGTVRYMAPEQLADSGAVSATTDVYALGAILYECVSGQALVAGTTVQEVMYRIMNTEPAPLSELVPTLPRALSEVIERCLQKSPAARPASAQELARLLQLAVRGPSVHAAANDTLPEGQGATTPLPQRRGRRSLTLPALLAASLLSGLFGWHARGASVRATGVELSAIPAAKVLGPAPAASAISASRPLPTAAEVEVPASRTSPSPSDVNAAAGSVTPTRPPVVTARVVGSATLRPPAVSRFDSTNPYAE